MKSENNSKFSLKRQYNLRWVLVDGISEYK
jgi:hypothetical protein